MHLSSQQRQVQGEERSLETARRRIPAFTPDQAQLTVMYSHGRWIAVWLDLEEPATAPPDQRAQMARVVASPESPFGIFLSEI